jgi:hypothetical protein
MLSELRLESMSAAIHQLLGHCISAVHLPALITFDPNKDLKEWTQALGIFGVAIAAFKGVWDMRISANQRKADLRWKQANAAKDLIADIHHDPHASKAVTMMDWSEGSSIHQVGPDSVSLDYVKDVLPALQKDQQSECRDKDFYIHNAFDWFFYYVDRIQHYIDRELIQYEDVRSVFKPYARKIGQHHDLYDKFLSSHDYDLARKFFQKFPEYHQMNEAAANKARSASA